MLYTDSPVVNIASAVSMQNITKKQQKDYTHCKEIMHSFVCLLTIWPEMSATNDSTVTAASSVSTKFTLVHPSVEVCGPMANSPSAVCLLRRCGAHGHPTGIN